MKKTAVLLVLLLLLVHGGRGQNLKQLRSEYWFMTGDFHTGPTAHLVLEKDSNAVFDWKIKFLAGNKLYLFQVTKESLFDGEGNEIPPGKKEVLTSYTYDLRKDLLKIDYSINTYSPPLIRKVYYRLSPLPGRTGFSLTSITEQEFMQ